MNIKNNVLISESGWLFLYSGNQVPFIYYMGKRKLTDETVQNFNSNIKNRSEFCSINSIPYLHIVFPGKPVSKSKYLSESIGDIQPIFTNEMKHPNILFPEHELQQNEASFFATDTHTSHEGSWLILRLILEYFSLDIEVSARFVQAEVLGDLSKMVGSSIKEKFNRFEGISEYDYAGFETGNRSALKGNTGEIKIFRNILAPLDKRVLIFGDSFINDSLNFQPSHLFREAIYFCSSEFSYEIIEFVDPELILTGQAERYLASQKSDAKRDYILLNFVTTDICDKNKLQRGFSRALQAILCNKYSKEYTEWTRDVDAYMLTKLADKYWTTNSDKAKAFLERASVLVPESKQIRNKLSRFSNNI